MRTTDIIGAPSRDGFLPTPRFMSLAHRIGVPLQPRAEFATINGLPTNSFRGVWRQKTGEGLRQTRVVEDDGRATRDMVAAYERAQG